MRRLADNGGRLRRCRRAPLVRWLLVLLSVPLSGGADQAWMAARSSSRLTSDVIESWAVPSAVVCALLCLRSHPCAAANWRSDGVCELLGLPAGGLAPLSASAAGDRALRRPATSCRQLQTLGYTADGVYWGTELPVPLYCDMTLTLGGGWTLLLTSSSIQGWDVSTVLERSSDTPSLDNNYSILRYGDQIRDVGTSSHFRYRLEALTNTAGRERWGGVWRAPRRYTLTGGRSNQTTELELAFDTWSPGVESLQNVVPWINRGGLMDGYPVLTTSLDSENKWWGTLVASKASTWVNAPWIARSAAASSRTVLYWMREE